MCIRDRDLIVKDILNYNTPSQVIYEPSTIPSQQRFPIEHVHDNINMRVFQDRFQNKIGFDKNIGIQESGCIFSFKNEKIYLQFDDYNTVVYSDIIIKELNEIQLFMFTTVSYTHLDVYKRQQCNFIRLVLVLFLFNNISSF